MGHRRKTHAATAIPWYPHVLLRSLFAYSFYVVSAALFVVLGALLLMPVMLLLGKDRGRRVTAPVLQGFAFVHTRLLMPGLGLYRFREVAGLARLRAHAVTIYVANHRGRVDAPLLLSFLRNTGAVIKGKYARVPLYATLIKYFDFVCVDTTSLRGLQEALERARQVLTQGRNLLIFPEGARSPGTRALTFGAFAFQLAADTGVPITPIVLHNDFPFTARRLASYLPVRTVNYTLHVMEPLNAQPDESAAQFAERVRELMQRELDRLDEPPAAP
jgi:1-acyl-sn-glycerol-3-phosphate acyltransferase